MPIDSAVLKLQESNFEVFNRKASKLSSATATPCDLTRSSDWTTYQYWPTWCCIHLVCRCQTAIGQVSSSSRVEILNDLLPADNKNCSRPVCWNYNTFRHQKMSCTKRKHSFAYVNTCFVSIRILKEAIKRDLSTAASSWMKSALASHRLQLVSWECGIP